MLWYGLVLGLLGTLAAMAAPAQADAARRLATEIAGRLEAAGLRAGARVRVHASGRPAY